MKLIYCLMIIIGIIISNCQSKTNLVKLDFPLSMQEKIESLNQNERIIVYYHSGECSFCYGTLITIANELHDLPVVSISASSNKILVDYYMEQIHFKGLSLIDSDTLFLKQNLPILNENNLFLIDSQCNILVSGREFNEEIKDKIEHIII